MVKQEVGLTVSAGVASSKFLAKVASDLDKPDGLTVAPPGEEAAFLAPLPLARLWGAGQVTLDKLRSMGLETIGDLARLERGFLERKFGRQGLVMWELAQARDRRPVEPERLRKSLGAEETYDRDIADRDRIMAELLKLSFKVARSLRRKGLAGRTITLKLKSADFKLTAKGITLAEPTCDHQEIRAAASLLLSRAEPLPPLRLIGITVSNFGPKAESPRQSLLFDQPRPEAAAGEELRLKRFNLARTLDIINDKFGEQSILPASLLKK